MSEKFKNINLHQLCKLVKLSERSIKVCLRNDIRTSNDIAEYYKKNKTFLDIENCGATTNNELINICQNFFKIDFIEELPDNAHIQDIDIEDLKEIENLSVRSLNSCRNGEIKTLTELIKYYNKEQTFKKIRNCGAKSNDELIAVCEKYIDFAINSPNKESLSTQISKTNKPLQKLNNVIENIVETIKSKNQLQELIEKLTIKQKIILNSIINSIAQNLSIRTYNALSKHLNDKFTLKDINEKILSKSDNVLKNIRNVEHDALIELKEFKKELLENIELISLFTDDTDLEIEYHNSLLSKYLPEINISKFEHFYNKKEKIQNSYGVINIKEPKILQVRQFWKTMKEVNTL